MGSSSRRAARCVCTSLNRCRNRLSTERLRRRLRERLGSETLVAANGRAGTRDRALPVVNHAAASDQGQRLASPTATDVLRSVPRQTQCGNYAATAAAVSRPLDAVGRRVRNFADLARSAKFLCPCSAGSSDGRNAAAGPLPLRGCLGSADTSVTAVEDCRPRYTSCRNPPCDPGIDHEDGVTAQPVPPPHVQTPPLAGSTGLALVALQSMRALFIIPHA